MDKTYYEIDYEIEALFDEYGDFPLQCATLLFDLLDINKNIVIKNQHSIKAEKASAISKYIENELNCFYEWTKSPEGNYCLWIKQRIPTNLELINILRLQGTYLSYIAPTDSFNWNSFLKNWKEDERYLLLSGQASFICNVIDMDRTLNINFSTAVFSAEKTMSIISEWERAIMHIAKSSQMRRAITSMRSKYGNKHQIRLHFLKPRTGCEG